LHGQDDDLIWQNEKALEKAKSTEMKDQTKDFDLLGTLNS
jgi:hypothetical protein